jgi:hypothetical protein
MQGLLMIFYVVIFSLMVAMLIPIRKGDTNKWGILFRWSSWWIGAHYSDYNKRLCVNLIPMFTIWIARANGNVPDSGFDIYRNDQKFAG